MRSMTGYGRCRAERDGREMTVEVRSVNHRFLDVACRLPRSLSFLDDAVRKGVAAQASRGHVDVFVSYANHRTDARLVRVDAALASAYQRAARELADALGTQETLTLAEYARLPDVLTVEEGDEDQAAVRALFDEALAGAMRELTDMRERAIAYHDTVAPYLDEIRDHIDDLELMVDNQMWPLPKYRELLFIR